MRFSWFERASNPKVVSERLGHSSVAFTLDTYAHVMPGMQPEAAELFINLRPGRPRPPAPRGGIRNMTSARCDQIVTKRPAGGKGDVTENLLSPAETSGAEEGIRTPDLPLTRRLLCRLSYPGVLGYLPATGLTVAASSSMPHPLARAVGRMPWPSS